MDRKRNKDFIFCRAQLILANALGCNKNQITTQTSIETNENWDSLAHMRLLVNLEKEIKSTLPGEEVIKIRNFRSIINLLEKIYKKGGDGYE